MNSPQRKCLSVIYLDTTVLSNQHFQAMRPMRAKQLLTVPMQSHSRFHWFLGCQTCRSAFVKFLVKFDLELNLKFKIFDGKNLVKFWGRTFLPAKEAQKFSGRFSGRISEQISEKISFQFLRLFSETSFSRRAVLTDSCVGETVLDTLLERVILIPQLSSANGETTLASRDLDLNVPQKEGRQKGISRARKPWSANRELRCWQKKGAVETGVKSGLKRRINRELEVKRAHKPWIREGLNREVQTVD